MEKQLPKNWVETSLGNLAQVQSGGTPSRSNKDYWNGNIPWVKISDIKEIYVDVTTEFITEEGLKNSSARIFPKGTILFTIFATLGKIGILNIDAATNQAIAGITPSKFIDDKYLTYSLIDLSNSISEYGKGVAQKNINQAILKDTLIPLPPLEEQNRIVAKLDTLFSQLENIKTSMEKIPVLLKNFRQQVLTQAVTGKLTEEWRKGKGLNTWKYKKIEKTTIKVGSGSTPTGGQAAYLDKGIPLIRSMNVHFNGIKYEGLAYLNESQAKGLKNVEVFENDILLNITGASIGRVCLAPKGLHGARVNQHVCIIRVNEELKPSFLNIYMSSPIIQSLINNENYGVTRQSFTKAQILELEIPIPHIEEQQIILSKVESLFAKADAIEKQYETLKQKIDTLPQAILHKAFKGELTEQLDSDGDARELFQQIQELKTTAGKTGKKVGKKVKTYEKE
jgi:type I restriction enzyme S subunit